MRRVLRLIAPSGPFPEDDFRSGVEFLREHFEVRFRDDILARQGFLAGSDERRADELREALLDDEADAVVAVRGGHGAMRLLHDLDLDLIHHASKPVVGFSDITALHLAWARARVPSLHASMVGALGRDASLHAEWLRSLGMLLARRPQPAWRGLDVWRDGEAAGPIIGGNLRVFASLVGTAYMPRLDGAVLLLEDVGERAYRIDRLLMTLRLHGVFQQVSAVLLGDFHECLSSDGRSCRSVLEEFFANSPFPVLSGLPIGHAKENRPLVLGGNVNVRTNGELHF